jgi:hypothetical protein
MHAHLSNLCLHEDLPLYDDLHCQGLLIMFDDVDLRIADPIQPQYAWHPDATYAPCNTHFNCPTIFCHTHFTCGCTHHCTHTCNTCVCTQTCLCTMICTAKAC